MTIQQELRAELTRAMKAKDRPTVNVIRQIESEIGVAKAAPGFSGEVDDALYTRTITSYLKRIERARQEFLDAGERGAEQADKLAFEIEYLHRWAPQVAGEEETAAIVAATIAELGADAPKLAGMVIGRIMKSHDGLDGGLVNRLVRQQLGG